MIVLVSLLFTALIIGSVTLESVGGSLLDVDAIFLAAIAVFGFWISYGLWNRHKNSGIQAHILYPIALLVALFLMFVGIIDAIVLNPNKNDLQYLKNQEILSYNDIHSSLKVRIQTLSNLANQSMKATHQAMLEKTKLEIKLAEFGKQFHDSPIYKPIHDLRKIYTEHLCHYKGVLSIQKSDRQLEEFASLLFKNIIRLGIYLDTLSVISFNMQMRQGFPCISGYIWC